MDETRKDLVKVSTYATSKKLSTTAVYKQAKKGDLKLVIIDGVKFVKIA